MKYCIFTALVLSLSACNTFRGLGEDLEAGGTAISEAATGTQEEINRNNAPPPPVYRSAPPPPTPYQGRVPQQGYGAPAPTYTY